jgi:hypothetical protein
VLAYVVNKVNGLTTFKCTLMSSTESVFNLCDVSIMKRESGNARSVVVFHPF